MKFTVILAAFVASTSAHMEMTYPPPINGVGNPNGGLNIGQREPLASPDQFPCRGYHSLLGSGAGAAVAKWDVGSQQLFKITGAPPPEKFSASHGGGSCQVSFSTDGGNTFRVVKSFIGSCPSLHDEKNVNPQDQAAHGTPVLNGFPFTVPNDLPTGPALFAWTWFNNIGNREMYMNCAAIEITGTASEDTIKFDDRPEIFRANVPANGGECQVPPGDADFPNPGPDVVVAKGANRVEPTGNCGEAHKDSAKEVVIEDSEILNLGLTVKIGEAAVRITGSVNESPAEAPVDAPLEVADGNRKAEVKQDASPVAPAAESPAAASSPAEIYPAASAAPVEITSSGSGGGANADACPDDEDNWNCIDGTLFSRCDHGLWSAAQPLAPGTACIPGKGPQLNVVPANAKRSVRFAQPHVRRHASRHRI